MTALPRRAVVLALVLLATAIGVVPALAQANPYTVSDVEVDVTAKDAQEAKLKAISQAQVKAFRQMMQRIATAEQASRLEGLDAASIGRLMASMSVQKEQTGPGRYIATLTISFLPDQVRRLLASHGVTFTEDQAPPVTLLPVWIGRDDPTLWDNPNPWRQAWLSLDLQNAVTPVIIPLGDIADSSAISASEALAGDYLKLEAIRARYRSDHIVVAVAEQVAKNLVRVSVQGETPAGLLAFDETFNVDGGDVQAASIVAAERVLLAMQQRWKEQGARPYAPPVPTQTISVAIPFSSLAEWNAIRGRLTATQGITNVDVQSLSGTGAVTRVQFQHGLPQLQQTLAYSGFLLTQIGDTWVLQPR